MSKRTVIDPDGFPVPQGSPMMREYHKKVEGDPPQPEVTNWRKVDRLPVPGPVSDNQIHHGPFPPPQPQAGQQPVEWCESCELHHPINLPFHPKKSEAAQPQPEPAQKLTDMLEPRPHAAVPIDCKHNLLNSTGICAECGEPQPEPSECSCYEGSDGMAVVMCPLHGVNSPDQDGEPPITLRSLVAELSKAWELNPHGERFTHALFALQEYAEKGGERVEGERGKL
jgi:hypothetical protein